MFDTISGNHDNLNPIISLGTDQGWRRNVLKKVSATNPESIIDIATGTGDLAILLLKSNASRIVDLDLSVGSWKRKIIQSLNYLLKSKLKCKLWFKVANE